MRHRTFALLLLASALFTGCSSDNSNSLNPPSVTLANGNQVVVNSEDFHLQANVKQLANDGSLTVVRQTANQIVLSGTVPSLTVGDIIIKNQGSQQFMVKVAAVTTASDGTVTVTPAKAGLLDVFTDAKIDRSEFAGQDTLSHMRSDLPGVSFSAPYQVNPNGTRIARAAVVLDGVNLSTQGWAIDMNFNQALVNLPDGQPAVSVNGTLQIRIGCDEKCDVGFLKINRFRACPFVLADGSLKVTGSVDASITKQIPISANLQIPLAGFGPIGLNGDLQLLLQIDGKVHAGGEVSAEGYVAAMVGADYKDGTGFVAVHEFAKGFSVTPPQVRATASLAITAVKPKAGIDVLGLGHVDAYADALRAEIAITATNSPSPGYQITTNGAFNVHVSASLELGPVQFFKGSLPAFELAKFPIASDFLALLSDFTDIQAGAIPLTLGADGQSLLNGIPTVRVGEPFQLISTGTKPGLPLPLPIGVTWSQTSTDGGAVAIGDFNQGRAVSPGLVTLTASYNNLRAITQIQVLTPVLQSIDVRAVNMRQYGSRQLSAVGHYSDGSSQDLTQRVIWLSATSSVARIEGDIIYGDSEGTSVVIATLFGAGDIGFVQGSNTATVLPPMISNLDISSSFDLHQNNATAGQVFKLTATAYANDGQGQRVFDVSNLMTWASTNSAVVTVDSTGLVTTVGQGEATIPATDPETGVQATVYVFVNRGPAVSVEIRPQGRTTIEQNGSLQLRAFVSYLGVGPAQQPNDASEIKWSLSNPSVASIVPSGGADEDVHLLRAGKVRVYATVGHAVGYIDLTLHAPVGLRLTPPNTISSNTPFQASVLLVDSNGLQYNSTARVTLSLSQSTAQLTGTNLQVQATNGQAVFSQLQIDTVGTFTLQAASPGLGLATSVVDVSSTQGHISQGVVYIAATNVNAVSSLRFNSSNGQLLDTSAVQTSTTSGLLNLLVDRTGHYLLATTSDGVTQGFTINSDGSLNSGALASFNNFYHLVQSTLDSNLVYGAYEANGQLAIRAYTVQPSTGALTLATVFTGSGFANDLAIAKIGAHDVLYANQNSRIETLDTSTGNTSFTSLINSPSIGRLAVGQVGGLPALFALDTYDKLLMFPIDPSTGSLGPAQSVTVNAAPDGLAVDPVSGNVYSGSDIVSSIQGYQTHDLTSTPTALPNSPYISSDNPGALVLGGMGNRVLFAIASNGILMEFLVNPDGSLSTVGRTSLGGNLNDVKTLLLP